MAVCTSADRLDQRQNVEGNRPVHPYTRSLISAILVEHPMQRREHTAMRGEPGSPIVPPTHCRVVSRFLFAKLACFEVETKLLEVVQGLATRRARFQREHLDGRWDPTT
jgi:oligopeptide/dipeptide ABC transporter ATP-binding protein